MKLPAPSGRDGMMARGLTLGLVGGLTISFDIPMIRMAGSDVWFTLGVRGACLALLFLVWQAYAPRREASPVRPWRDRDWIIVGLSYGVSNIFFTFAVYLTSTANLVFILAFNPMICALLAWIMIGERPNAVTWAAIAATILGVGIIVAGSLGSGSTLGDLCAVVCCVTIAYALVRTRQSGKDLALSPGLGGLLSAGVGLPLAMLLSQWAQSIMWLLANGLILIPLTSICLAAAPRFIRAEQVALFYLLETVLAPIWVWFAFDETPARATLIGGAVVLATILFHTAASLREPGMFKRNPAT